MAAVGAQPMSAHALLRDVSREGLTNGVRCASVAGMKTQLNTGGAAAGVVQSAPSDVRLIGVAGERLASDVRCAKVTGMNRQPDTQITRGRYCLAWLCEPVDRVARSLGSLGGERKECFQSAEGFSSESRSKVWLTRSASLMGAGRSFSLSLISGQMEFVSLLFIRASAVALASAFGEGRSVRAIGCLMADEVDNKNILIGAGVQVLLAVIIISDV